MKIAIVFSEPTAMRNSTPTFRSARTMRSPNGITAKTTIVGTNTTIGASQNSTRSALRVVIGSLNRSFSASATGCSSPLRPTRLGPILFCISPTTRRSIQMNASTLSTVQSRIATTPINPETTYGTQSGAPQSRIWSNSEPTVFPRSRRSYHSASSRIIERLRPSRHSERRPHLRDEPSYLREGIRAGAGIRARASSVHLAHDNVHAPEDHDRIGHRPSDAHQLQRRQVDVRRRPDVETKRGRASVAHQVEAQLASRRLDSPVGFAYWWPDRQRRYRLVNRLHRRCRQLSVHRP